ncbi:NAD(P)-dependent oxidoreductase [Gordonia sp. DT30]|uniref:NAD(P)-dependent oxidoreductase n=1 Tax=Gordonia sp. DT30 TaxID=3416546 RepID=UPI003CF332FF
MACNELSRINGAVIADRPARAGTARPSSACLTTGITIFGCTEDEGSVFCEAAARLGIRPTIVESDVGQSNAKLAHGNKCISISHKTQVTNRTLLALSKAGVEYISTRSIGYDHVELTYADRLGISVGNVAYSPDSVADYTLMLILMSVRHAKSTIRRTDCHDYRLGETRGQELRDLTVGVVGTGRIGTAVIDRLRGFGCRVLWHDRQSHDSDGSVPLCELIAESDIVTLHTPLTTDTHHLLDRRRIEALKPGAYVINTGRGPLLDTGALLSALESGRLGGAALDVVEGEEGIFYVDCRNRRIDNETLVRLQRLPNVVISPHSAYDTEHALRDIVENSLINCLGFESEQTA